MRELLIALGTALGLVLPTLSVAQEAPPMIVPVPAPGDPAPLPNFTFRDLRAGSPFPKKPGESGFQSCSKVTRFLSCQYAYDLTVGGAPVSGIADYRDRMFYELNLRFNVSFADQVKAALLQKYGPPCREDTSEVQNSYGAKFTRLAISWCFSDGTATFLSIGPDPRLGAFSFVSKEEADRRSPPGPPKVDF